MGFLAVRVTLKRVVRWEGELLEVVRFIFTMQSLVTENSGRWTSKLAGAYYKMAWKLITQKAVLICFLYFFWVSFLMEIIIMHYQKQKILFYANHYMTVTTVSDL